MPDRREFLSHTVAGLGGALLTPSCILPSSSSARDISERSAAEHTIVEASKRFPHFLSVPVSYRHVKLKDTFWAPRQRSTREISTSWITKAHDTAGGLDAFRMHPRNYAANQTVVNMEAIKFIEAMATVVGVQRDQYIEGLTEAWIKRIIQAQGVDGYLEDRFPPGLDHPVQRWEPVWWSHEAYTTGHYIESAIAYREATGDTAMYESAVRAADNMVIELMGGNRAYTSGHPEIEQALMRLYGETGERKYLQLCGWFLEQRGRHERRPSFGRMRQDDIPIKEQRQIEGHAVMAAYLFNGATLYVGATGDAAYREAILAVWDDFANRRMYIHGAGGNQSSRIEGYRQEPYCILPDDAYGESCSVFANFQWAHCLFRLTGDAKYIDTAERMLYNAFYASLSLKGDASFYCNVAQTDEPNPRSEKLATSCCPPNIVKLFNKVGGYFYSTDAAGIYVNHFGASEATIPFGKGVKIVQRTEYPWNGKVTLILDPATPQTFAVRLRAPKWADSYTLYVNEKPIDHNVDKGWLAVHRRWRTGDTVTLDLPMDVKRVTMPPQFKEYENRAALQRGPIVYCLEQQDLEIDSQTQESTVAGRIIPLRTLYIPENEKFEAEYRPELLGGVTVLKGEVRQLNRKDSTERPVRATFVPYGVWGNRSPGAMRIWLGARKVPLVEMLLPEQALGESCAG